MRVLVTGATGGLGRLIINKLLDQGVEVIVTSHDPHEVPNCDFYNKVKYFPLDINKQDGSDLYSYFTKPDALIHLAWEKLDEYKNEAHITTILENHKKFISNLIEGGLKDITAVGTCYEYGLQEGVLKENMPSKPILPYPQGKNLLREFIEAKQKENNFSFKWIRVFYVFGEVRGRKNLYTHLVNAVKNKDESFNMSGGEQVRDFLSPDEIAATIVKISLQNKTQGIINCCSGKPVKLKDFVSDFLTKNGYKIKLNLGVFPYVDYEPMETWGDVEKLNTILNAK